MKSKISTGIWLIFFGIIALLDNFDIVDFNFYAILKYWPLLIVSLGVNLIFQYKNYGTAIIVTLNIVLCVFLAFVGYTSTDRFNWAGKVVNTKTTTTTNTSVTSQTIRTPLTDDIKNPELTFNIGASTVNIDSNTSELIEAKTGSKNLAFDLNENENKFELNAVISDKNEKDHTVNLSISNKPDWDLIFNVGASRFIADFSSHKINKLQLNSGAASVDIKLGHPSVENVDIEINTAASSCKISIPKDAACAVDMTTILSNNKLSGFTKKGDIWQTENYETASKRYFIELNGAANSLKIDRY